MSVSSATQGVAPGAALAGQHRFVVLTASPAAPTLRASWSPFDGLSGVEPASDLGVHLGMVEQIQVVDATDVGGLTRLERRALDLAVASRAVVAHKEITE